MKRLTKNEVIVAKTAKDAWNKLANKYGDAIGWKRTGSECAGSFESSYYFSFSVDKSVRI